MRRSQKLKLWQQLIITPFPLHDYQSRSELSLGDMASQSIPRLLLPRGRFPLRSHRLQQNATALGPRHASTSGPQKARLLEKPDKFRAPSHPQRLRTPRPSYAGPSLSQQELEAQKTKQYPHMMPPEGSFMHWFLTNKFIHLWITLVSGSVPIRPRMRY